MKISLQLFDGQVKYSIDGIPNNPPLVVYRGDRVKIEIDTIGHPVIFKTAPGLAHSNTYLGFLPGPRSVETGVVSWEVAQDAPAQLFYQSLNNPSLLGVVLVKTLEAPGAFRFIDKEKLDELSVSELVATINHNISIALSKAADLAGYGLKWNGTQFSLDSGFAVYEDGDGFYTAERQIYLRDQVPIDTNPRLDIGNALNQLASQIRRIINPNAAYSAQPAESIDGLLKRLAEFDFQVQALGLNYGHLKQDYEALLLAYQNLLLIYKQHNHNAQDVVVGVLNPARIGFGQFNSDSVLRGGYWTND
jgi:hypothetical protein